MPWAIQSDTAFGQRAKLMLACIPMLGVGMGMGISGAALAQDATNSARVDAPGGVDDPTAANNSAIDSDPIFLVILAVNDTATDIDGVAGDPAALNVLTGDTLDGNPVAADDVEITVAPGSSVPAELTFDPTTGVVGVVAGTPPGQYSFEYRICEELNPTNCAIATATVDVAPVPSLVTTKVADDTEFVTVGQVITYTYTVTNDGGTVIRDVSVSDTHNGAGAAPTPTNETLLTDAGTIGDSTDAGVDGSWDVLAPGDTISFTGTYTVLQADIDNLQ